MRASSTEKLTLLAIIVGHLSVICVETILLSPGCRDDLIKDWHCLSRRRYHANPSCIPDDGFCSMSPGLGDCLLPQFHCHRNGRCIPRSWYCNGIVDCNDGSDEMGCRITSSDFATARTMLSVSIDNTFSYTRTTSTIFRDTEVKTTPSSFITDTSDMIFQGYETNTFPSSTTSVIIPESEKDTSSPSTTMGTVLPDFEANTTFSTFTTVSTILQEFEANTISSPTTTSMRHLETEYDASSSTKTGTFLPYPEENTTFSFFAVINSLLPESEEITSSPTTDNTMLPESSAKQLCPDKYCMQNAECIIAEGQYRCNCPSYTGELCEIQLRIKQRSHEYTVTIVVFMTLVVLCLSVVSVFIYRYKRFSAWKSNDTTSRTLSQLTLTSHNME